MDSTSDDQDIPSGWEKKWSNGKKRHYYVHPASQRTQWHPPGAAGGADTRRSTGVHRDKSPHAHAGSKKRRTDGKGPGSGQANLPSPHSHNAGKGPRPNGRSRSPRVLVSRASTELVSCPHCRGTENLRSKAEPACAGDLLIGAALRGCTGCVASIVAVSGINVDHADGTSRTALLAASFNGNVGCAKALVAANADPNKADSKGNTPLVLASQQGHASVVSAVAASERANINAALDSSGRTALLWAIEGGHVATATILATMERLDGNHACADGSTALILASRLGQGDVVRAILISLGDKLNINQATRKGLTALIAAARGGHSDIIKRLLKRPGINANLADRTGATALSRALLQGHVRAAAVLAASHCVRVYPSASNDGPALRLLLQAVDVSAVDAARHIIRRWGDTGHGAAINYASADAVGSTALIRACEVGSNDMIHAILQASAIDVNHATRQGHTALIAAIGSHHAQPALAASIVKTLLAHPAIDANLADSDGFTPLMHAAMAGHGDAVREVLQHTQGNHVNQAVSMPCRTYQRFCLFATYAQLAQPVQMPAHACC